MYPWVAWLEKGMSNCGDRLQTHSSRIVRLLGRSNNLCKLDKVASKSIPFDLPFLRIFPTLAQESLTGRFENRYSQGSFGASLVPFFLFIP
jgi:hypothetical protein